MDGERNGDFLVTAYEVKSHMLDGVGVERHWHLPFALRNSRWIMGQHKDGYVHFC
jgi:hypothetical protein